MPRLFANNAFSTLAADITDVAGSLTVATGHGARFPSPTGGDYFLLTIPFYVDGAETAWEIVRCTARTADVLTITRAQESTAGVARLTGNKVELRLTAADAVKAETAFNWGNHASANYRVAGSGFDLVFDPTAKVASFAAVANTHYLVSTASAAVVITLPAAPVAGTVIGVTDVDGYFVTVPLTLGNNGKKFYGVTDTMSISTANFSGFFLYTGSARGWVKL